MSTNNRAQVLVIEDEPSIRSGLCDVLAFHGHAPTGIERGDDGLEAGLAGGFALVVLDLMLPGLSGFEVCEQLRAADPRLPILMLTARGAEEDVLRGFRAGADDYVTKPFSIAELIARVEALLRRSATGSKDATRGEPFRFGRWLVEPSALIASCDDHAVEITPRELDLLLALVTRPGHIVSRRALLCEVWGYPDPDRVETRTIDMHVSKLRRKLGPDDPSLIETIRGEGYRYSG
jgi:DNA-binding response OmpR family regulator